MNNQQDKLKFERLSKILDYCKTLKVIDDFENFSNYSLETIRLDLKAMTEVGLIARNYVKHGKRMHKKSTFIALKDTFTEADYAKCKEFTCLFHQTITAKNKGEYKPPRPKSSVVGNVTTFNIDDYADKVNQTARMHRTYKHTGIGSSFGLAGW